MTLKNLTRVECQVNDKLYELTCPQDSPLTDVKEALFRLTKFVGQIEDSVKKMTQEQAAKEEPKQEECETCPQP